MESRGSADAYRQALVARLREEADSIAVDILEQVRKRDDKWLSEHGGEIEELTNVIRAVLKHCFSAIEGDDDRPVPPEAVAHAREMARTGCGTDALLERYIDCKAVFMEHLRQANLSVKSHSDAGFTDAHRRTEDFFRQLLKLVGKEHRAELKRRGRSRKDRDLERVKQLLSGELSYPPEHLGYDCTATHIGVVGSGPRVEDEIKRLAQMLGGQSLIVQTSPDQFWAWIGFKRQSSAAQLKNVLKADWELAVHMGIGRPAADLRGWRRTHRQAKAAFRIAVQADEPIVSYPDVALLATAAEDHLLPNFLSESYLAPLTSARDGGETLKVTLRAYFSKGRQISSAAKALGIKRHTVRRRLDDVEELLGRTLDGCAAELELALRVEELLASSSPNS